MGALGGGARNTVVRAVIDGRVCVARRGSRHGASLAWEVELLSHLRAGGVGVPSVVATQDGRTCVGSIVVMEFIEGGGVPPDRLGEIVTVLARAHAATGGWPQRPGFSSSSELLASERGGDVDLGEMPEEVVDWCRSTWSVLPEVEHCAVHGDPNPRNAVDRGGDVVLLDWDEARVDHPWLDLGAYGAELSGLSGRDAAIAVAAATAFEVATCWHLEPAYARHRFAQRP